MLTWLCVSQPGATVSAIREGKQVALTPDFGRREVWWEWAWAWAWLTITIACFWALDIYTLIQNNRKKRGRRINQEELEKSREEADTPVPSRWQTVKMKVRKECTVHLQPVKNGGGYVRISMEEVESYYHFCVSCDQLHSEFWRDCLIGFSLEVWRLCVLNLLKNNSVVA